MRKTVRPCIQLPIAQLRILVHQCDRIRRALNLLFKQLLNAFVSWIVRSGFVPFN